MLYRNTKTGVVVFVQSEIKGDWEKVEEPSPVVPDVQEEKKTPVRRTRKKVAGK